MMLSGNDIELAVAEGAIEIVPYLLQSIRPAGIVMHLGPLLMKPIPGTIVDAKRQILPTYEEITIGDDTPYELKPSEFILGATYEKVTVGPKHGLLIEGRSTLARLGLTIVQTAMLVYPGHRDRSITLELANHGPNSILLYPKMKIARSSFFELRTECRHEYDDHGKYRNQNDVGAPIFVDEFLKE